MMSKKILIIGGIFIAIIVLFAALNFFYFRAERCKTDADCRYLKCPGAYCENRKCKCPEISPLLDKEKISQVKVAVQYRWVSDW